VCCVNWNILVRCEVAYSQQAVVRESLQQLKIYGLSLLPQLFSFSHPNPKPNPTHLPKHESLSPNHQFSQHIWYEEYYFVHAYMAWSQKFRLTPVYIRKIPLIKHSPAVINAVWISIADPLEIFSKSSPIRIRFWIAESGWIAIRRIGSYSTLIWIGYRFPFNRTGLCKWNKTSL